MFTAFDSKFRKGSRSISSPSKTEHKLCVIVILKQAGVELTLICLIYSNAHFLHSPRKPSAAFANIFICLLALLGSQFLLAQ